MVCSRGDNHSTGFPLSQFSPNCLLDLTKALLIRNRLSSRGESLTTHRNQMKLFNAIAAAVVLGGSLIAATPAEAQRAPNGWVQAACADDGDCLYVRYISRNGSIVKFQSKLSGISDIDLRTENCRAWQVNSHVNNRMKDVFPGTLLDAGLEAVCS